MVFPKSYGESNVLCRIRHMISAYQDAGSNVAWIGAKLCGQDRQALPHLRLGRLAGGIPV
jgi:hypothetical protein